LITEELLSECRKGNLQEFRKLIGITSPFAFSVAFRILCDEEHAKDVVQETMMKLWEKIDMVKSPESFKPWLYRIVVNKCYDHLREKKRRPEFCADESAWALISNHISEAQPSALENSETARIINLFTDRLSPRQKTVFVLCDLEEMTQEEVAEITGMSRFNIKANLHYARRKIGDMLKKYIQDGR
jgi:RNA polymerase sigma-70 factor (ECF subfamily)